MSRRYYDDDDVAPSSYGNKGMNSDNFFSKIYVNLLATYTPSFGDDYFFERLLEVNRIRGPWVTDVKNIRKAYLKNDSTDEDEEDDKPRDSFGLYPRKYLPVGYVPLIADKIRADYPEVNEDYQLHPNCVVLSDILELTKVERLVLNMAILISTDIQYDVRQVLDSLVYMEGGSAPEKIYSRLFNVSESEVKDAFRKGFLFNSGLLSDSGGYKNLHTLTDDVEEIFAYSNLTHENIEEKLFPNNLSTKLSVDSYPHISKEISRTAMIINKCLEQGEQGTNVMFWGLPGTGKTELALVLAKEYGWDLKVIGDISDQDNSEKSRAQRLASLKIGMKLFSKKKNVVLLFDEMEDIFKVDNHAEFSKAFINRIIDTTKIPIIWTTNNLEILGNHTLRRMVFNIGFQIPPRSARKVIWRNYATQYKVDLADELIDQLASTFPTVPALIGNAVKITQMTGLSNEEIPEVLKSLDTLMNYGEERKFDKIAPHDTPYDLSCANANLDLPILSDRLLAAEPNFTLCLYGPPGTGKSEFGRYLAKKMGKSVLFKRASDLQSMWLGETEKNIARAFKEASEEEMVLIIDEGDSFLRSRESAERSYEVSQVNEMLSQMEDHAQPFIITTNLFKELDQAAMRRFTFKVAFDFMKPAQSAKLFELYFNNTAPVQIMKNDLLTPGDFANVLKKTTILRIGNPKEIYQMLEEECDLKPQKVKIIGFGS
jgi:SpoVK/Ycf46/Vps4 family AAA+-type ATPase